MSPEYANEMAAVVVASPWKRLKGGPEQKTPSRQLASLFFFFFFISSLGLGSCQRDVQKSLSPVDRRSIRETTRLIYDGTSGSVLASHG